MKRNYLQWRWLTFAARGVLAVLFGALVLFIPARAGIPMVTVFAIYAIVDGVVLLALAPAEQPKTYLLIRSLVSVGAGVIALIIGRGLSFGGLVILLTMWAGAAGLMELAVVFRMRGSAKSDPLVAMHAILTLVFGVAIMLSPLTGFVATALWVGVYALAFGVLLEAAAVRLRHVARAEEQFVAA
ncbi:MAG TPA: DUF308 domain-containing protein [Kofleriaceae bacterium]|nr:DUF308 domain-containing protein [Kofleriaceae bacterium]